MVLYTGISFTYQKILSRDEWFKQGFERVCLMIRSEKRGKGDGACIYFKFAREHKDVLPLDFILGFYVTQARV